ncbi:hypothetical protein [uncultured Cohaesibacter sp.]|uniref:hypothetical protein n=1 Tax=uncultured Cohaesibacter sp. TaxID=1002546 RepID=UPI0029C8501E|nr:hypothetical protein [uncultured Cohaesibacter sp.]
MNNVSDMGAVEEAVRTEAQILLEAFAVVEQRMLRKGKINSLNASIAASASYLGVVLARIDDPEMRSQALEISASYVAKSIRGMIEQGRGGGAMPVTLGGKDA